ncbi:MAG TPA: protein translocase subunit SecD [Opitutaceae bacterium]|jgi:SecD/SecF fusion protein
MLKNNLWKLILSFVIAIYAVSELVPLKSVPFETYARTHVTAHQAEFIKLLDEAQARSAATRGTGNSVSTFSALLQIGKDRRIDLTQYFPDIPLESTLVNIEKRNEILLGELERRSHANLQPGLDLAGGVQVTLQIDPRAFQGQPEAVQQQSLQKAIDIISHRINGLGVGEPVVRPIGTDRIEVELPGLDPRENPQTIDEVKAPALLEFKEVYPNPNVRPGLTANNEAPPGYVAMTSEEERPGGGAPEELYIRRIPMATGAIMEKAGVYSDQFGQPQISMQFTSDGRKEFARITKQIVDDARRQNLPEGRMAIVLDGRLYSAPTVHEEIDSPQAQITGSFTDREALSISNALNNPLPFALNVQQQLVVGPTLAADAISSGKRAAIIGAALVAGFMITYYTVGGLIAVGTLALNIVIILGVMASFHATMTLPGLAGIVLTIGMAVDANILVFERMREELKLGKSIKTALSAGYDKAFITIVDAHVTQLVICLIMIAFGAGPIRGFGVTLAIGVFSTMFTVLVTAHLIMEWLIGNNTIKKMPMLHFLHTENFDFVKYGLPAFICSWTVVLIGLGIVIYKGHNIEGIDFAGGDVVSMSFHEKLDPTQIRQVADANHLGEVNPAYVSTVGGNGVETLSVETQYNRSDELVAALEKAYPQAGLEKVGEDHIGPTIGSEIMWNAVKSVLLSMVVILIYVAFRFEFGFGVGAVVASIHDIFMTIGVFVMLGHRFSSPMVAAILSIAGYSINDTIVVFDRIREELKLNPTMKLRDVVNLGINRVFSRSMMTSFSAFLAALALFVFGTGVMKDLALTFLIGIVTGTGSSIFIASPVFYWWHKGDRKHVEAHSDVAPKYEWTGSSKASK